MRTHTKIAMLILLALVATSYILNPSLDSFRNYTQREFANKKKIDIENPTVISNYLLFSTFTYDLMVNGKKVDLADGEEILYVGFLGRFYQI